MPLHGSIYEPTQVLYLNWWGPVQAFWNFDQVPAGEWHLQSSKDLVNWTKVEDAPVCHLKGPSCLSFNQPPEIGFCRLINMQK